MEPAIGVYANSLAGKLLDVARFVNRLQQREKTYLLVSTKLNGLDRGFADR